MAIIIRKALNAQGDRLILPTAGLSAIGIGVTGTWVGTITVRASNDGLNFFPVGVLPFPITVPITPQSLITANGNFMQQAQNYAAWDVIFTTRTSGTAVVSMATASDVSYQDAFLAVTSLFVSQSVSAGAVNVVTQAAQANRGWRLRTLVVGFSTAPAAPVDIKVQDGGSATLWETYVPIGATGLVGTFVVPLPVDPDNPPVSGGGVFGTPGNTLVVTLAAPGGSVVSTLNCEFIPC